jgi:hypothetical protein
LTIAVGIIGTATIVAAAVLGWPRFHRRHGRIEMPVGPSGASVTWSDGGPPRPEPYVVPLVRADAL